MVSGQRVNHVESITYLGSQVYMENEMIVEIRWRIVLANQKFFGQGHVFRNHLLTSTTKLRLNKMLFHPVLVYSSEAWTFSKSDEQRSLFGLRKVGKNWKQRSNQGLYELSKEPDIVKVIHIGRLRWVRQVTRMTEQEIPKKIMSDQFYGQINIRRIE